MPPENLFEPLTIFLIWYIIPGYLTLVTFITISKALQPSLKFSLKKIKYFDKVVFSARARKNPRWLSVAKPAVNCA